jgi:hypothetical protein
MSLGADAGRTDEPRRSRGLAAIFGAAILAGLGVLGAALALHGETDSPTRAAEQPTRSGDLVSAGDAGEIPAAAAASDSVLASVAPVPAPDAASSAPRSQRASASRAAPHPAPPHRDPLELDLK